MNDGGYFAISRSIWSTDLIPNDPFSKREAWIWMISEASYKPRRKSPNGKTIDLGVGQLAHSIRYMANAWKWQEKKVRRFLERCKNRRAIYIDTAAGITVITICNYTQYQHQERDIDAPIVMEPPQERRTTAANLIRDNKTLSKDKDVSPMANPPRTDIRKVLFSEGVGSLQRQTGKKEQQCRSIIGRWLKNTDDDAVRVLNGIKQAEVNQISDAIAFLSKTFEPKLKANPIFVRM